MRLLSPTVFASAACLCASTLASEAAIAQYASAPGRSPAPGYPSAYPSYATPQPSASSNRPRSTNLEVGFLYGTSAAWGVGTGVWLDAEAGVTDPGLALIAPGILGVAAPVSVWAADNYLFRRMPDGLPSSIATGMLIGAGEGLGVSSTVYVRANQENEWSFRALGRSEVIGSTLGGAAGYAYYYFLRPTPRTNVFISSSVGWGMVLGSEFGGGASNGDWGQTNDSVSLGGLIGFNVALAGAATLSAVWTPSWTQLGWMWGGFAAGTAVSLPVYIFYAGSDHDPRRGLIFQGVAGTLGLGLGAILGVSRTSASAANESSGSEEDGKGTASSTRRMPMARLLGGGLSPLGAAGGTAMGVQLFGELR